MKVLASLPLILGVLSFLVFSTGCESGGVISGADDPGCTCGDSQTALVGCYHSRCLSGLGNPQNPACVCGGLAALGVQGQLVSDGGSSSTRLMGQSQILYLASGKKVSGTLIADNGLVLKLRTSSGERDLRYEELAPRSIYRLEKGRTPRTDGLGLMKLGDLAREAGFWAHANRHYKEALKVDPALRPRIETALAGLREEASQAVLAEAREDMRKKRVKDAEKHLTAVLNEFPDERAAVEAAAMLDRIHTQDRTRSVPARDKQLEKLFASAVSDLEYAADSNHKGLTSKSQSRSINSYRNAISRLERGRKKLAGIEKKNKDDRVVVERADELDAQAIELYVTTSLNLVSSYMVQTSYNEALKAANAAVAVAPTDQRLLSARARIENAAADSDWGFGWVRGR